MAYKIRSVLLAGLGLPALVFAATFSPLNENPVSEGRPYTIASALAVASTGTAYSDELVLSAGSTFGYEAVCAGTTPDVKLEWQSTNTTNDSNFVTNTTAIDAGVGSTREVGHFSPEPSLYGRVKFTGQGSNGANATCTVIIFLQGAP